MELTHYERYVGDFNPRAKDAAQRILESSNVPLGLRDYMVQVVGDLSENPYRLDVRADEATSVCHYITVGLMQRLEDPFSYEVLAKSEDYSRVMAVSRCSTSRVQLTTDGQMHYHLAAHELAGTKVYLPSRGLAEQLYYTELDGLTVENLQLPYKAIYIMVPDTANLKIWNHISDWHKVVGVYVVEDARHGHRNWRFLVCGERKALTEPLDKNISNDALVYFSVALPAGMALEKAIATTQKGVDKDRGTSPLINEAFSTTKNDWKDIFQWVMNVVMYITSDEAEFESFVANKDARQLIDRIKKLPSKSKKRRRLQDQLNRIRLRRRTILGKSEERVLKPGKKRGGWTLEYEVLVKGHRKQQAYGPGWAYRKWIRIRPYTKGPEGVPKPGTESVAEAEKARSPSPN